jgi:DHA1 family bicyclomycin/chloramphenicol resistance-like MFS transporter
MSMASWKMVFLTPPLFAVVVFIWSLRLEESLPRDKRISLDWSIIGQSIRKVVTHRTFLRYTGITTLLFTALSSYVASSEHIIGDIYGRPRLFPWIFAGMGLTMSMCSLLNSRLSTRYGARRSIRWLLCLYAVIGSALLVCTFLLGDPPDMRLFFTGVTLMLAINLAVEPNSSALALEPMGDVAGVASSVYGTVFFFIGATLGSVISQLMRNGVLPLALGFFVLGVIAVLLVLTDQGPMAAR